MEHPKIEIAHLTIISHDTVTACQHAYKVNETQFNNDFNCFVASHIADDEYLVTLGTSQEKTEEAHEEQKEDELSRLG